MSKKRKQNKYAHLHEPEAIFDFHDHGVLREEDIQALARDFVEESVEKGLTRVLIITGKGLHSSDGPVIRPLLQWYLHKLPKVLSVQTARRDRGGEGALELVLRG